MYPKNIQLSFETNLSDLHQSDSNSGSFQDAISAWSPQNVSSVFVLSKNNIF